MEIFRRAMKLRGPPHSVVNRSTKPRKCIVLT
jgi:hypothetical protein